MTNYDILKEYEAHKTPVPSYQEYLESESHCAVYSEVNESLKEENQQLKTQIAKLTEIVGVLPSNHSVGNLGYRIKNQRHEINNRLKEIDKLKKLLKDLRDEADGALQAIQKDCESDDFSIFQYPEVQYFYDILTKIDNATGEK